MTGLNLIPHGTKRDAKIDIKCDPILLRVGPPFQAQPSLALRAADLSWCPDDVLSFQSSVQYTTLGRFSSRHTVGGVMGLFCICHLSLIMQGDVRVSFYLHDGERIITQTTGSGRLSPRGRQLGHTPTEAADSHCSTVESRGFLFANSLIPDSQSFILIVVGSPSNRQYCRGPR
jgi:hypothetical protein